jgi:hypothetical protein
MHFPVDDGGSQAQSLIHAELVKGSSFPLRRNGILKSAYLNEKSTLLIEAE